MNTEDIKITSPELKLFQELIVNQRKKYYRTPKILVDKVFEENPSLLRELEKGNASKVITEARELVWQESLIDEYQFNSRLMRDVSRNLPTPKNIIEKLISSKLDQTDESSIHQSIIDISGEYSGQIFPYVYILALSNTQSRRSRSGKTLEAITYKIYESLNYPFDSQGKVGKDAFSNLGLGKIVDSILPNLESFKQRRDKVIIGTMKTSIRERWQEVVEEISRTTIPKIYLLTVDPNVTTGVLKQMSNHNVILVAPVNIVEDIKYKNHLNIISFEDYLFKEIPEFLNYWKKD